MKGITPVVATVLLLFISVSLVGTASVYVDDIIGQVQEGLEDEMTQAEREDATQITVIDSSSCKIRNTGGVEIEDNLWFVDGQEVGGPSGLSPGETGTLDSCSGVIEHPQGASAVAN